LIGVFSPRELLKSLHVPPSESARSRSGLIWEGDNSPEIGHRADKSQTMGAWRHVEGSRNLGRSRGGSATDSRGRARYRRQSIHRRLAAVYALGRFSAADPISGSSAGHTGRRRYRCSPVVGSRFRVHTVAACVEAGVSRSELHDGDCYGELVCRRRTNTVRTCKCRCVRCCKVYCCLRNEPGMGGPVGVSLGSGDGRMCPRRDHRMSRGAEPLSR